MNVSDAPNLARSVTKQCGFLRRQISQISKSEQDLVEGATESRECIASKFHKDVKAAERAIGNADRLASAFDSAAILMRAGDTTTTKADPMSQFAVRAVRLGLSKAKRLSLALKLANGAQRGREAASKAADRMSDAHDDLSSVAELIQMAARLPAAGFKMALPSIAPIRKRYLAHCRAAQKRTTK